MMPKTGRRHTLLCMLALHVTLSLCGGGHHAFDAVFAPGEVHATDEGQALLQQPAGGCVVCDLLSLPVLPAEIGGLVVCDRAVAVSSGLAEPILHPSPERPAAPPRAPPRLSA